jgi:hypothetical protein
MAYTIRTNEKGGGIWYWSGFDYDVNDWFWDICEAWKDEMVKTIQTGLFDIDKINTRILLFIGCLMKR